MAAKAEAVLIKHDVPEPLFDRSNHSVSGFTSKIYQRLQNRSRRAHVASFLGLFVGVALLDLAVDPGISLYCLYLVPALYAAWFLGPGWGYLTCALSALVWLGDDFIQQQFYRHAFASYGDLLNRGTAMALIVVLVKLLKTVSENQYEMETRHVQRELDMAREVHSRLLPSKIPSSYSSLDISYTYEPALVIGGDYYDFIPITPDRLAIVVADVSGKGLSAALLMASLQGLVRSNVALHQMDLAGLMDGLNSSLYELTALNRFATLFFGIIDTANKTLDYVNAAQNPPLLFGCGQVANPDVEVLDHAGLPLGAMPASQYQSSQLPLCDGDVLVAYTDGLPETRNAEGEEFGEERLREAVRGVLSRPAAEIREHVRMQLREFAGETPAVDDLTLMIAKIKFKKRS
ncbi:MAG TPA: PP2C family protein-serine/threonine phosphatase [Bryobacteraceae bacterium]|jgi:serine phosphatase RsbU (regulator of sigma subunit)|nr:PP2C family protein-serine/threonine phosphatase [Bryobacteraceae bacterium]